MATSVVDICNNALIRIGSDTITSLNDVDKNSTACNAIYVQARDMLLRQHLWNFAIKRAQLAQETTAPAFGFKYSYPLPSDFVRTVKLEDTRSHFKIEQGKLLTDDSTVKLIYIARIEDPTKFDPLFVEALTLTLAIKLTYIGIGSNSREQALKEEFNKVMFIAKQVDGQDDIPDSLDASTYLESKWAGIWDTTNVYGDWPV